MSPKRFLPMAVLVALLAPTVAIFPGAAAQDTVPTFPTVPFETVPGVGLRFYLNIANPAQGNQPDCANPAAYGLGLRTNVSTSESPRLACPQTGTLANPLGGGTAPTATFTALSGLQPLRSVTLAGNNSIIYEHGRVVEPSAEGGSGPLTITFTSGGTVLARGTLPVDSTNINLSLVGGAASMGRGTVPAGQSFSVSVSAPEVPTFAFRDTGAYVELRAEDAIKAAVWITDERSVPRTIFAPIPNNTVPAPDRRLVGFFAIESAFGFAEATRSVAPRFQVLLGTQAREIGPGGATFLEGRLNDTASIRPSGIAVWSFPVGTASYMGFPAGAYTLHAEKTHGGAAISRASSYPFQITAQSVRLEPFRDPRVPTLLETEGHAIRPGGSTTYLLGIVNTGAVNDTFTLNVTSPNPPAGWSATLGGPDVRGRSVYVTAGNTSLVTVTVNAPLNAGATDRIIHLVNATSTIDPGARSTDRTLVTTVGTAITRELGIAVMATNLSVEPGGAREIPVYVWNRGTRTTNVSVETPSGATAGWSAQLLQGAVGVERVVLNNIEPGAIAEVTLRVSGPPNQGMTRHNVLINATALETSGVATDRTLPFTLGGVPGVSMRIFDTYSGHEHRVELGVADDGPTSGANTVLGEDIVDGVNGTWFRVWVTNTGRVTESFALSVDSVAVRGEERNCNRPEIYTDLSMEAPGDFGFYFRSPAGNPQRVSNLPEIAPGRTAEVYIYVPIDPAGGVCAGPILEFVAQARGSASGVVARASAKVTAEDSTTNGVGVVAIEAIARDEKYALGAPLVNIDNAERRSVTGGIEIGKELIYLLRVTAGASYRDWTDSELGTRGDPTVHVVLEGVDKDSGWNASIRPVRDATENTLERNPYVTEYNVSNANRFADNRREAWFDQEIEVRIQAPSAENGTALAGEQDQIQVRAFINGSMASTIELKTVVTQFANVTLRAESQRLFAHPSQAGAFLVYATNNGSSPSTITVRANINSENTPNAAAWRVEPSSQTFPLAAFKNRSIALLVTPPAGAAQGSTGEVNLTLEYARNPLVPTVTTNVTQRLTAEVVAAGTLTLSATTTETTLVPGGFANYSMTLRNSGGLTVPYTMRVTDIPNWTVTLSPASGQLAPGESRSVVLVLRAPTDVTNEARFATVVRVEEDTAANNFDALAFTANILGGKAIPSLSVPQLMKRVDRAGTTDFEVAVKNLGSAAGRLRLELRTTETSWNTSIRGPRGDAIDSIMLGPNELATINVSVQAPRNVPERFVNTVEITALTEDRSQASRAALQAEIHDYGVRIELVPSTLEGLPGIPSEITLRVRNTGNDNDTLNVSADLRDLPEWAVQFSQDEIRLEPGSSAELRATIRSPVSPLPTARTYTFPFWVGTRGGQEVDVPKNETASMLLTIPSYRAFDMDRDGSLEIVVDQDRRSNNGFEVFREVFTDGVQTQIVAAAPLEGKTRFFLDVPRDRPYDGIADVWFDPEGLFAFEIRSTPDLNQDGTPDYLIDTDHDIKIDMAYDTVTDRYFDAVEIKAFNDDRIQYLVDLTGDGKPDRYFDPEGNVVTRTEATSADVVGLDTDDDKRVDKHYNINTKDVSDAKVAQFSDFARQYWYFFVAFAVLVVLVVSLVVVRRR